MDNLPNNFLKDLEEETGIKTPNLCRYIGGKTIPRPERAIFLSKALKKQGVEIQPSDFSFNREGIKKSILDQLAEKVA